MTIMVSKPNHKTLYLKGGVLASDAYKDLKVAEEVNEKNELVKEDDRTEGDLEHYNGPFTLANRNKIITHILKSRSELQIITGVAYQHAFKNDKLVITDGDWVVKSNLKKEILDHYFVKKT